MTMYDPYFNTQRCIRRLSDAHRVHKNLIVGFDFDDTVYDFHNKGHRYPQVIELLQRCVKLGFTMVLVTAKETQLEIDRCVLFCIENNIRVDYVNKSPVNPKAAKPYLNILLDDKAGLYQAYHILRDVVGRIEREKARNE